MDINIKKVLIAAVAVTIVGFIFGMVTCGWLFSWVYTLEPTNVWKVTTDEDFAAAFPLMLIGSFVLNIILAGVYALVYKGIPGEGVMRGLWYGVIVWLVGVLPGMFSTYTFMTVAATVVVYWLVQGLIAHLIYGAIIAAIYKEG